MSYVFANNVQTTLAAAASSTSTTLTLASSANLPTLAAGDIFYDVNGKAVGMTLTDIENFFNAVEAQADAALSKQATLLADIAAATTVSAVQAIVW